MNLTTIFDLVIDSVKVAIIKILVTIFICGIITGLLLFYLIGG